MPDGQDRRAVGLLGGRLDALPARVQAAIRAQQDDSERLIGWFQLGVVATFGTLYAISPKTNMANPWTTPVAIALALYLLFTLLRLAIAYRRRLPPWFLVLSVIVDMALLMVLIWSFHIQYMQPPTFYLKAPTLLYAFIFIALRALRFEPLYVVAAGLSAAVGWLALAAYAALAGGMDMITRDYVAYLTSNRILLGAEFDKVISILVVTAVLAVGILRARRLMVSAGAEHAARQDLARFFSPEVADRITQAEDRIRAGQGEAREAAILTMDIRGFTRLSTQMPPAALMHLLADYQGRMVPAIQQAGGSIDKFLGDGILATFGAALPSAGPAAEALRAADSLIAAADAWNAERAASGAPPIRVGVAVSSGRVVFGAVGGGERLEYTVIGEPVNFAAKMEKRNGPLGSRAITDAATYALALDQGYRPDRDCPSVQDALLPGEAAVDLVLLAR